MAAVRSGYVPANRDIHRKPNSNSRKLARIPAVIQPSEPIWESIAASDPAVIPAEFENRQSSILFLARLRPGLEILSATRQDRPGRLAAMGLPRRCRARGTPSVK